MNDGLKQRIIGAVVLLALAVIFLPVIFDKERIAPVDRQSQVPEMPPIISESDAAMMIEKQTEIAQEAIKLAESPKTRKDMHVKNPVIDDVSEVVAEPETLASPSVSESKSLRDQVKSPDEIFIPDDKAPESLESEASGLDENGVPKTWVIQVASYQSLTRAEKMRDELISIGYKSFIKSVKTASGETTRVYVGPSLVKDSLLDAKVQIETSYKVKTLLLRFKP